VTGPSFSRQPSISRQPSLPRQPSFPRQYARTRRFSLGAPRNALVAPGGDRILFLRSRGGDDPLTCLWWLDVAAAEERLLVDPSQIDGTEDDVPPEELARRERLREQASGIVDYATDETVNQVAFALSGRLWLTSVASAEVRELAVGRPVLDPRPDPTGRMVAYVSGGALWVVAADGRDGRLLIDPDGPQVTYGLPEFVAAEEMGRTRGYWWSPRGDALLAARVDTSPVARWYIADPANPDRRPRDVAYPAAGTANADVSLWLIGLDGSRREIEWDRAGFEYLVNARWTETALLIVIQSRDQRRMQVLEVDPVTGATRVRRQDYDPQFLDIVPGLPQVLANGSLVWTVDADDTRRLVIGDELVTPPGLQVRGVLDVDSDTVLLAASEQPTEIHLWTASTAGYERVTDEPGVHSGRRAGGTTVVFSRSLDRDGTLVTVRRGGKVVAGIASLAATPVLTPRLTIGAYGPRALRTALLWPANHGPGSASLPVLLDPYGGPGAQRVLSSRDAFLVSQWFADQGFAVLVIDGRGTPGRGPAWERTIRGDFATPVLDDQVDGLLAAAAIYPDLDLGRVAIRGWSFGGFLAALAVLRRPDLFRAAVSGAPVTDHRFYDTHYMERYLGDPAEEPDNYERCSLIGDAPRLQRPLLVMHGLADDNVVVAHTLRLSSALLEAARPHCVLPLSGVTHMTPQEVVAENRLLLELDFLKRSLGLT
jgi:dipeptidyl-peptidase-4